MKQKPFLWGKRHLPERYALLCETAYHKCRPIYEDPMFFWHKTPEERYPPVDIEWLEGENN